MELISLLLFHRVGLNCIFAGPVTVTFSILYQYSRIVPASYHFRIFGLALTNKSFFYILVLQVLFPRKYTSNFNLMRIIQLAISHVPTSVAVAVIGTLAGRIYRSDLANLKAYRIPPYVVRFSRTYLLPLIGSTRPQRRLNHALPDETRASEAGARVENDEVITTARSTPGEDGISGATDASAGMRTGTSVVREWVDELTGRGAGMRAPPETEIVQLMTMFPNLQRDVVVGALQRR